MAWRALGHVSESQLKALEAEKFYLEANTAYARIGSDRRRATVLRRLGYIRLSQSKYDETGQLFIKADAIGAQTRDNSGQADSLKLLSDTYRTQHMNGRVKRPTRKQKISGPRLMMGPGWRACYQCAGHVVHNLKLARRKQPLPERESSIPGLVMSREGGATTWVT